jgi:carbonic anhydrase
LKNIENTPFEKLLRYHNEKVKENKQHKAELIIGTCMDNRINLNLPEKFAYIIRTGGNVFKDSYFHIAYAIAIADIKHVAIIGHNDCGMVDLINKKEMFINGLSKNSGLSYETTEVFFNKEYKKAEIKNERENVLDECKKIKELFPGIYIAPFIYSSQNDKLTLLE